MTGPTPTEWEARLAAVAEEHDHAATRYDGYDWTKRAAEERRCAADLRSALAEIAAMREVCEVAKNLVALCKISGLNRVERNIALSDTRALLIKAVQKL